MIARVAGGLRLLATALAGALILVAFPACGDMAMAGACGQGGPMGGHDARPALVFACSPVDVDGEPLYRLYRLLPHGAQQLSSEPAQDPAVAPTRSLLAFDSTAAGMPNVYVAGIGGGSPREVMSAPGGQTEPAWSPSGTRLAYVSGQRGLHASVGVSNTFGGVFVGSATGTGGQPITSEDSYAGQPAWAPRGQRIAYATDGNGNFQVATVAPDGTDPTTLTGGGESEWPTWSPNGDQIAYQWSSTMGGDDSIWIMDANGTHRHRLTSGSRPSWSPDGKWIAFVRKTADGSDLWMISPHDGHAVRITDDAGLKGRPSWV